MKPVFYVPERGDVARISTAAGHASGGFRLIVVLSPESYNSRVGLALVCPLIEEAKGYPFEVPFSSELAVSGVVLADQISCLDWRARRAEKVASCPPGVLEEVLGKLRTLIQ